MYSHFIIFTVTNTHTELQTTQSVALIFHNPTSRKFSRITRKIFNVHNVVNMNVIINVKLFLYTMKQLNNGHYE